MKSVLEYIRNIKILRNKVVAAIFLFLIWIVFLDENNLVAHRKNKLRLKELKEQRSFYREKIAADKLKMEELRSGSGNLEKYAREQFNMSRPDEDLFLVTDK